MTKIKKKDRDLEWISAFRDMENPGRIKARRSSNMVFVGSACVVGFVAIIYAQLMSENMQLTRQIRGHQAYMADEVNQSIFEWHTTLQDRTTQLVNYSTGAEKFLEQLKTANRVSEETYRYYETALRESTSQQALITSFSMNYDTVEIRGTVPEESMPRMYAEYLDGQTDEEGEPLFSSVQYSGFNQAGLATGVYYEFSVTVTLWDRVD